MLHHLQQVSSRVELDLGLLEDIVRHIRLLLFDGHGLEGVAGQHLLNVVVLCLDLSCLQGLGAVGPVPKPVVLILDLPTHPDGPQEEDSYDHEVLVLTVFDLSQELLPLVLETSSHLDAQGLPPGGEEGLFGLAAMQYFEGLLPLLVGGLLLQSFDVVIDLLFFGLILFSHS